MRVPQLTLDDYENKFADRHRLQDVVAKWAKERPDAAALVSAESGRAVTWREFDRTTDGLGARSCCAWASARAIFWSRCCPCPWIMCCSNTVASGWA